MYSLSLDHLPPDQFCTYVHHDIRSETMGQPHDHDFHELFWIEDSEGHHWINGQTLPLRSGDLILIHARDTHALCAGKKEGRLCIVNFAFPARVWTYLRKRYFNGAPVFFSAPSLAARSYTLDESQLAAIRGAAALLRSGLRDRLQTETFLLSVLALLDADRFRPESQAAPGWIREACSAIATNRNFAGGMPALSRLAKRSPEHIAREFRRHLNTTPTDVINNARMSHAADRLATSNEEIIAIALDCGLENLGHFYRLFHTRFGCTPRAYRLQQRAVVNPAARARRSRNG
jgi:AraC family transcriptional regulator, dual regulator of chb operon